jgi:diguanylate cyclase (GGDEF)-like protein
MPILDTRTLLVVGFFTHFLMGGLTLLAALHGRHNRTLLWCAIGCLLGGLAYLLGLVRDSHYWDNLSIWLSNMLLITTYGCLWTSLRSFAGRPPQWFYLFAGAGVWAGFCLWPVFMGSAYFRIVVFSLLAIGYMVACSLELWSCWRVGGRLVSAVLLVVFLHGLFYAYRMVPQPNFGPTWVTRSDFTLTVLENILFIISLAYGILVMVGTRSERRHRYAAQHDELTGLANRRALFEWGRRTLALGQDRHEDIAVLMCDLDRFKHLNDQHGHEAGNRALAVFAEVLRATVQKEDLCARIGGDEFIVLVPGTGQAGAERLANEIRRELEARSASIATTSLLSISIGIACTRAVGYDLDSLLIRADQALYQAKRAGRNCVRTWWTGEPARTTAGASTSRFR